VGDISGGRKFKISSVLDQSDDTELSPLPQHAVAEMIEQWRVSSNDGECPAPEQEATGEQLAALRSRLKAGLTPYADFAIWRPFGTRLGRHLKFLAHFPTSGSGWRSREINGPPTFSDWRRSRNVFAFAMEVLGAAGRTRLERYAARIEKCAEDYPELWWIVGLADIRCRSEHLERVRRWALVEHRQGRLPDFNAAQPWDVVFREVAKDHTFWSQEVDKKAMQFATKLRNCNHLVDEGYGRIVEIGGMAGGFLGRQGGGGGGSGGGRGGSAGNGEVGGAAGGGGRSRGGGGKRTRAKRQALRDASRTASPPPRRARGQDRGNADARGRDGKYYRDGNGKQLCWAWNSSTNGCEARCSAGRVHRCEWCRSDQHRSCQCEKAPASAGAGRG